MKLRYKITGGILAFVVLAIASLALLLGHDADCAPAAALNGKVPTMKAIVYRCYGTADVLRLEDVEKPTPGDDELLVRVRAAAVNPLDWHYMRGTPYIMRLDSGLGAPKNPRMGVDYAGTVEAVGRNVTQFKPGDEVFGGRNGSLAEFLVARADRAVVPKPANMTFELAASVPVAADTVERIRAMPLGRLDACSPASSRAWATPPRRSSPRLIGSRPIAASQRGACDAKVVATANWPS